jgi:hypothetical protein
MNPVLVSLGDILPLYAPEIVVSVSSYNYSLFMSRGDTSWNSFIATSNTEYVISVQGLLHCSCVMNMIVDILERHPRRTII